MITAMDAYGGAVFPRYILKLLLLAFMEAKLIFWDTLQS